MLSITSLPTSNLTCSDISSIPKHNTCSFVILNCQAESSGFIDYFKLYYCHSANSVESWLVLSFIVIQLISCFISIGLTSSEFLCLNLSYVAHFFQLPDNLSGLTLLLFGNGSPDIIGTYLSFQSDSGSLLIGELIGSAFLISTLVIGTISIVHPFKIPSTREHHLIYLRDVWFFLLSVVCVLAFLADGKLKLWESFYMVLLYLAYVLTIVGWNWMLEWSSKQLNLELRARDLFNFDQLHDFIQNLELEDIATGNDRFESVSSLPRTSLLGALEFETLLESLRKSQSIPVSLSLSEGEDDYELRGAVENSDHEELGQTHDWEEYFPLFLDFQHKSLLTKILLITCLPIYILLRVTIPVITVEQPLTSDNNKLILWQTGLCFVVMYIVSLPDLKHFSVLSMLVKCAPILLASIALTEYLHFRLDPDLRSTATLRKLTDLLLSLYAFITSVSWISIIAAELISILKFLGHLMGLSDLILGLTLYAIGNSTGDFIANYTILKMGYPLMALLACFGGPLLNLLLGIGVNGVLVVKGKDLEWFEFDVDPTLVVSGVCLFLNLCFLLVAIPQNNWTFDRNVGMIMILIWVLGTMVNVGFTV